MEVVYLSIYLCKAPVNIGVWYLETKDVKFLIWDHDMLSVTCLYLFVIIANDLLLLISALDN